MGTLTFSQLQDEVRAGLGNRTDLDSRLGTIVNLAQQRLAIIHDFDEMEVLATTTINNTGSDNDKYVTLPYKRSIYSIVVLNGAQSLKLTYKTPQSWDRIMSLPEYWSRDQPRSYTLWNDTIEIFPLPMQTYTLRTRYTSWPTPLVNSTDVSAYINKDEVMIELSLGYALRSLGKEDDAAKHEANAIRILGNAVSMDDTKPDLKIVPGPGDHAMGLSQAGAPWLNPFVPDTNLS